MQFTQRPARSWARRLGATLSAVLAVGLAACASGGDSLTAPEAAPQLPGNPIQVPVLRQSAFVFDVDVRNGRVTVTEPVKTSLRGGNAAGDQAYSILSSDVINVQTSNFFASSAGAITPNRIRVFFDVTIANKLGTVELLTPTFPTAPAGQNGVLLFPFSTNVLQTSGGVGSSGDVVVVELPSNGSVDASPDWNGNSAPDRADFPGLPGAGGNPFNFFNDASCTAAPPAGGVSDCFRYETMGPIPAGASSSARRVGFDIDASVGQFRARLIVAADVRSGIAPQGTVAGIISSPERGPLAGVSVQISGLANAVVTDAAGAYSSAVGIGPRTVTVLTATLPAGCSTLTPANGQSVTVNGGGTSTQNYAVTCIAATGTINGTLTRTGSGTQSLAGIVVRINPTSAGLADVTVAATGAAAAPTYTAVVSVGTGAGVGAGVITLENLPTNCAVTIPAGGTASYTGLTLGGTLAVGFTVNCIFVAPPAFAELRQQFGAVSGGTVDLSTIYDSSPCIIANNPACFAQSASVVEAFSQTVTFLGGAQGRITARASQVTALFGQAVIGGSSFPSVLPSPLITYAAASTAGGGNTVTLAIVRLTIGAGAPGTLQTSTSQIDLSNGVGDTILFTFSGAGQNFRTLEGTVSIP